MKKVFIIVLSVIILILFGVSYFFLRNKNVKVSNDIKVNEKIENESFDSAKCKNPVIPEGFNKVETENASWEKDENGDILGWNNGLVVEDEIGNQFVWVPVDCNNLNYSDVFRYEYKFTNQNIDDTIKKYGGFYISRFEAGVSEKMQQNLKNISEETNDIEDIPVSKKGIRPWNYISEEKALKSAEKMYNSEKVKSSLMDMKQAQWITNWLDKSGYNIQDSTEFGNYSNSHFEFSGLYSIDQGKNYDMGTNKKKSQYNTILSSGATERNISNNIYDWAGNLWELTKTRLENTKYYYSVGGYYATPGKSHSAYANYAFDGEPSSKTGFRIALIIS